MDPVENERATAQELTTYAQHCGYDLESLRNDTIFQNKSRSIFIWRKRAELPCTGRPEEEEGILKYNMQGAIAKLPCKYRESESVFRGGWTEAGTFASVQEAFNFVKAWLLDVKEVDELPQRQVRREGIF